MDEAEKKARSFMIWARLQYSQVEKGQMSLEAYLDSVEFRLGQYFRELLSSSSEPEEKAPPRSL